MHVDVQVNGASMRNNGMGAENRGNFVIMDSNSEAVDFLPLGAVGPASFDFNAIPGNYLVGLESYLAVGHGLLKPRAQDVLPTGAVVVGSLDVGANGASTQSFTYNVGVRNVRIDVSRVASAPGSIDLVTGNGGYAWIHLDAQPARVYAGCQAANSGNAEGPTTSGFSSIFGDNLGEVCVPCGGASN